MSAVRWSAALALDLALGEPPRAVHPVVLAGKAIAAAERRAPDDARSQRAFGLVLVAFPAAVAALAGTALDRLPSKLLRAVTSIWMLKTAFALRDLLEAGDRVERSLRRGDTAAARRDLAALVSRDTGGLRSEEIASAAIESLAENLCDSYVAPLLFYRLGGLPAALAYRVVNTADAMVGYRGRYEHLGKAAARLDDVLNWVPARVSALALACGAALRSRRAARRVAGVALRDHRRTASPNAGWPMSAAAGALDVRLAKPGHYSLNDDARDPGASDIGRARDLVVLSSAVATLAVLLSYRSGRR
jgi:adenosylcobinamide-phosphate synthase